MRCFFSWSIVATLLLLSTSVSAQDIDATIVGTITDAETGDPLVGAHVFIASSMNGSVTNDDGKYRLTGVPLGALRLYVSSLGYEPQPLDVFIRRTGVHTYDFKLEPAILDLGEITVTAEHNKKWRRQLEKFTTLFIGETPHAGETEITNPEVLDFESKGGDFRAIAAEPLIIENKALGYRIQYFLKEFKAIPNRTSYDGEPLFEEMEPDSPEQAALWHANREAAFYGSFRHFMLALFNKKVEEQGFMVYARPASSGRGGLTSSIGGQAIALDQRFPVDPYEIVKDGTSPNEKILDFEGFIEIVYTEEVEDKAYLRWIGRHDRPKFRTSMISTESGPTIVDLKGDVLDPYGVTFYQYWAFERVADEVPREYRPWLD